MIKVGEFEVEVDGPYPCWITIKYRDQEIRLVRHTELSDLAYALAKAIHEAKQKLGRDAHEIMEIR